MKLHGDFFLLYTFYIFLYVFTEIYTDNDDKIVDFVTEILYANERHCKTTDIIYMN